MRAGLQDEGMINGTPSVVAPDVATGAHQALPKKHIDVVVGLGRVIRDHLLDELCLIGAEVSQLTHHVTRIPIECTATYVEVADEQHTSSGRQRDIVAHELAQLAKKEYICDVSNTTQSESSTTAE